MRRTYRHQLLKSPRPKPQRNPPRPRFFERATPNQMWQTDIFTFRLGGKNADLIGFLTDDHSRYVVGLDVFRSQTAEHVLEVFRRAVAEYGVPKEVLSDQGRQYSRLARDHPVRGGVAEGASAPHQEPPAPSHDAGQDRTLLENHLGGVPGARAVRQLRVGRRADPALGEALQPPSAPSVPWRGCAPPIASSPSPRSLRQVIERGLQDNVLELALSRGQPRSPFYMVGRMGAQSVVIRAEKGQVKMLVDGAEPRPQREVTYDLEGRRSP